MFVAVFGEHFLGFLVHGHILREGPVQQFDDVCVSATSSSCRVAEDLYGAVNDDQYNPPT